jgi:hypothetical protein
LRVGFSRAGVAIASGGARFRIALSAYGYSSALRPLGVVAPVASANRVSYERGSLMEWYANGPLGLEQGFDVAARPRAGSGPLTFSLALSGNLAAKLDHSSVLLAGKGVALRYGGLVASDARGRALRSWLELVRGHVLIRVDDRGAVYPLRVDPFVQQAELTAGDGVAYDDLGGSVAVSGNTIVAGAPGHKVGSNANQGAVYVFVMPASGWANATQTAELTATDGAAEDNLGSSVAISGDTIVAGARYHTVGSNTKQGAAYVFVMPAAGWAGGVSTQTAELTGPGGAMDDLFGVSVAVSGDTVVVGARDRNVFNAGTGAAYVFTKPASGWAGSVATPGELFASDGATGDRFGGSVAVSGNTVIAGASHHNTNQGAAYVFVMPASGWAGLHAQNAELLATSGAPKDLFATWVAVSGNTIVASAPFRTVGLNAGQGAAYVFVMPASGWAGSPPPTAELTASDGAAADNLATVAISGNTIVAGTYAHKVGVNSVQGAAYVFVMPASGWAGSLTQTAELTATDGAADDGQAGFSVAVSGNAIIAGVPGHTVGSNAVQGTVYAFLVPPSITLAAPANGATYTQGEAVTAAYSCTAPAGATVTACAGPVANGAPIDTQALGSHTFTVNALDSDGATASQSASYTVAAAGGGTDMTAPVIQSASAIPSTFAVDPNGSAETAVGAKAPRGTTFGYTLSEAARVVFTIERPAAGRKSGKKCVSPSRRNGKKRKCTRYVFTGRFAVQSAAGPNSHHFSGRIGRGKLKPGRYRVTLGAIDAASNVSALRRFAFRIVKK